MKEIEDLQLMKKDAEFCKKSNRDKCVDQILSGLCDVTIGAISTAAIVSSGGMAAPITVPVSLGLMTAAKIAIKVSRGREKVNTVELKHETATRLLDKMHDLKSRINTGDAIVSTGVAKDGKTETYELSAPDRALLMLTKSAGLLKQDFKVDSMISSDKGTVMKGLTKAALFVGKYTGFVKQSLQNDAFTSHDLNKFAKELEKNGSKDINKKLTTTAGSIHTGKTFMQNVGALLLY